MLAWQSIQHYCLQGTNLTSRCKSAHSLFNGCIIFQDTFRGRVCECPVFNGVQFKGDGYSNCEGSTLFLSRRKSRIWNLPICFKPSSIWICILNLLNDSKHRPIYFCSSPKENYSEELSIILLSVNASLFLCAEWTCFCIWRLTIP